MNKLHKNTRDLTGKRFGRLKVLSLTEERRSESVVWECICDCGITCYISSRELTQGKTKSCGCLNSEDLTGKTFSEWTVLKLDKLIKQNKYWLCECSCGDIYSVRASSLLQGRSKRCKRCAKSKNGKKNRKSDAHVAVTSLISNYKSNAKKRGIPFNLSRKEFEGLIFKNCSYCGRLPSNVFSGFQRHNQHKHSPVMYTGIDRIDNTKGYSLDNCVPCCAQCNYSKSNLSEEQFLSWIRSVYITKLAGIEEKTVGVLTDELATTVWKCFMSQEDIMNTNLSVEEQTKAAHKAQELNARRNQLIRAIDQVLGFGNETPTAKTYYDNDGKENYTYFDKKKE